MPHDGFIYFIQAKSGPIKIGYTKNPKTRFDQLVVGHYEDLILRGVLPGTLADEKNLHKSIARSKIRGEWFHPTEEVLAIVAQALPAPVVQTIKSAHIVLPHERGRIEDAIATVRGNLSEAAQLLGCSRRTLQNRMRSLGMPRGRAGRRHRIVLPPK